MTSPSIVFAHGLWADGSCFSKLIPRLQSEGHDVMASQHGLDSLATDVAAVKACLTLTATGILMPLGSKMPPVGWCALSQ